MNYRTAGEAKQQDMEKPNYTDLDSYLAFKKQTLKADTDMFGDLLKD